jgi:hypothetical protein
MRVGIYAYGPTSVQLTGKAKLLTFSAETKESPSVELLPGANPLGRGIYLILPIDDCAVSATGECDMITPAGDKDDWPDPKAQIASFDATFASVDYASLKAFFAIARGLKAVSA